MVQRFKNRKKPNYKRGILLVVALFIIVYLWMHADEIVSVLFSAKN
ncbi:hypothetical protein [Lutibacter sp.]|nr:hypothetical protein [Lutibacter sp.]MCF6181631.1 hypothetical protein [Lutibacter sp.]